LPLDQDTTNYITPDVILPLLLMVVDKIYVPSGQII